MDNPTSLLETGADGVVRLAGSTVPFDAFLAAFNKGYTLQELADQFPELQSTDLTHIICQYARGSLRR